MRPIYKASDGSEHKTADAAETRESLLKEAAMLQKAARAVEILLGESALTADGQHFQWYRVRTYWRICNIYGHAPRLQEVNLYPYSMHIDFIRYDTASPHIAIVDYTGGTNRAVYKISELYASKKAATVALLAEAERGLAEMQADVDKLRAQIAADGKY